VGDDWGIIYEKKSLFDDPAFLKHIFLFPAIQHGLKAALYTYSSLTAEISYRPLNTLSYFLDYKIWGMRPFGFHTTNILFHCGNVVLLYFLGIAISGSQFFGFLAGLLFALHPFATEPVSVVSFREDLMALFFILISCLLLIWYLNTQRRGIIYFGLSFLFYISAILCKENSVVAWGIYFYLIMQKRQKLNDLKGPAWFLILTALLGLFFTWMRFAYNPSTSVNPFIINFKSLAYSVGYVFGRYVFYLFIPWHFQFYFPWQFKPPVNLTPEVLFYFLVCILTLITGAYIFLKRKGSKELRFGLAWMGLFLAPLIFVKYLPSVSAARYLYISGAGGVMIIASVLLSGFQHRKLRWLMGIIVLCYFLYLACKEMQKWQNDVVFYEIQKQEFPNSWIVHKKYGDFLLSLNYLTLALKEYTNAYLISPFNPEILEKLATTLFGLQEFDKAEKFYLKALDENPNSVIALKGLGVIYGLHSQKEKALLYLNRALRLNPEDKDVVANIEKVKAGRKDLILFRKTTR
jgi:tetratricopeptide (TPR) repeat protein